MLKIVLDDYKHNYKTGLRKYFNSYMVSAHFTMFVIMPINMEGRWLWYCFIIIPLIFADIFSIIYGGMENRTLFLCPLSKEQRETFFKTSLWIRISIPMILLGISSSILVVCEQVPLLELFILVVVMLIYVISINICCLIDGKMLPNQTGKMNAGIYYIWIVIIRVSGSVNVIAIITEVINKDDIIWKVDRATLKFKIEPNDTVCFDSVVWCACEGIYDYISPTAVAFHDLIDTYYFMKITYNKKQYKFSDNKLIHNFFRLNNEHPDYVRINEEKKNTFGWE